MSSTPRIAFVLVEKLDGVAITPSTISLSRFNEFNQQVADFIAGSERLKLDEVHVHVSSGSYKLTAILPRATAIMAAIGPELLTLQRQDSLGEIDPKRAEVIATWQSRAKSKPGLRYAIRPKGMEAKAVELSATTDFRIGAVVPWVKVEKYLFGTVMNMGGAQKANIHVRLDGSGQLVRIDSNQDYLKDQEENRLYRKVLVRVVGDQHCRTGQLKNLRLLAFEDYDPQYNEDALERFAEAGQRAWADVPDATEWLRRLRGGA